MEEEAAKQESDILDAPVQETPTVSKPSASEVPTLTPKDDVTVEEDDKHGLIEQGVNNVSENKRNSEVVGNAEKASIEETTTMTRDETKQQLKEVENAGVSVAETKKDKESEMIKSQEKENQSPSPTTKRKRETDSETKNETNEEASNTDNTSDKTNVTTKPNATFPKRPIKRARTAYFIFTDEKRPEVQAAHPGEGVAAVAKALGQMWGSLSAEEKKIYQDRAAKERERVSQELEAYKAAGGKDLDLPSTKAKDPLATILPVARIRKICKLDPEVRGLSKEALLLVTKCSELMLQKLGKETVKVAQLQNRRKLLPDDVAHVCAHREQFLFLKDDVKDLVRSMESSASSGKAGGNKKEETLKHAAGTKKLTSYFSASK